MNAENTQLIDSFGLLPSDFGQDLKLRLTQRLEEDSEYSKEEIERVSANSHRICAADFALAQEDYERIRVLCILSQFGRLQFTELRSHRRVIGPLIVFAKRILWRVIGSQLEKPLLSMQEFCSWMLIAHVRSCERIQSLERTLLESKETQKFATN